MPWQNNDQRGQQGSAGSAHSGSHADPKGSVPSLRDVHLSLPPEVRTLPDTLELAESIELPVGYSIHPASTPEMPFRQCLHISIPHSDVFELLLELSEPLGEELEVVVGTVHAFPHQKPDETIREGVEQFLLRSVLQPFEELVTNDACMSIAVFNENGAEVIVTPTKDILCFSDDLTIFRNVIHDRGLSLAHQAPDLSRLPHTLISDTQFHTRFEEAIASGWGSPYGPQRITPMPELAHTFRLAEAKLLAAYRKESAPPPYKARYVAAISHDRVQDLFSDLIQIFEGPISISLHSPDESNRFTRYTDELGSRDEFSEHIFDAWQFVSTNVDFAVTLSGSDVDGRRHQISLGGLKSLTIDTDVPEEMEALLERYELEESHDLVTAEEAVPKDQLDDTLASEKYSAFASRYLRLEQISPNDLQRLSNSVRKFLHNAKKGLHRGLHILSRFGV